MAKEYVYSVKGMHCASCEILIEKKLLDLPNIKAVDASTNSGEVVVEYEGDRPNPERLNKIFESENYKFSDDEKIASSQAPRNDKMEFKMKKIEFMKISAAGNDFILIDNRKRIVPRDLAKFVEKICHRKFSVGADGVMLLEDSKKADFKMRFFNADGSSASMCGNGGRSIARFAHLLGIASKKMDFETDAGLVCAEILGENVRLALYEPKDARLDFTIRVDRKEFDASFINT